MIEFYYLLVAYFTNASCTLAVLLKPHLLCVRVFGEGKTLEGLLIGFNMGLLISLLLKLDFRVSVVFTLATLGGDLLGSFIKRRLGFPRGQEVPLMDQLGFLITGFYSLTFFYEINLTLFLLLLLITYFVHKASNKIAFALKLKNVPW